MKTMPILVMAVSGALMASGPLRAGQIASTQNPADTVSVNSAKTPEAAAASTDPRTDSANNAPKLSWGLDDIAKLSKAGVDESVILAYINNANVGYNPTAQDVIQLRELGVSAQITAALMQRGGEVRQAATVEAQRQGQAATPVMAPRAAQPTAEYAAPTYAAPVSTVTYIGYTGYTYGYAGCYSPSYYSYPYYSRSYGCYGGYYGFYPGISFGVNLGSAHSGGFHGSFHGSSHGGFHGGSHHGR